MDSEDGQIFVKASINLAYFVRTHERALANALQLQRTRYGVQQATVGPASATAPTSTISLADALNRPSVFSSQTIRPAKLTLTPHHLWFLLSKFVDLGVDVGPMNVRLENLHSDAAPSNYVSFLGHAPKSRGKQSDADSLKSVSSVRSMISTVSSMWSGFSLSNSAAKEEKRMAQYKDDIRYLYSCFTKIPALKLSPDHRARLIAGYEEFPFDTAVPVFVFKNLSALEICDLDFRQFHGWDRLAEQLRSLTVRRAHLDDPIDLLQNIVLDDIEKRRKRSSKTQAPTTPSTPGVPWPTGSPRIRGAELARSFSSPNSPLADQRRSSLGGSLTPGGSAEIVRTPMQPVRQRSNSPIRPPSSRHGSLHKPRRNAAHVYRRSSGSSAESDGTPRHSTADLLAMNVLPPSKWRMLRHLSLAENGLTSLTAESLRPVAATLQSLDLSGNLFTEIPDALASLTHLRALNMSNCMIDSLKSLAKYPLPAITTLNLRSNRLLSLAGIEKVPTLERVDLRDNKLYDPTELRRLTTALDLVDVYVLKNPFTRTHGDYRVVIFNAFRDTPGHNAELTIDTLGPTYNEKKLLHDKAPEPSPVPVVQPPAEEEEEEQAKAAPEVEDAVSDLRLEPPALEREQSLQGYSHRRTTSDMGPQSLRRKKRAPRKRIVELSQQEAFSTSPVEPSLLHTAEVPPQTPSEADEPTTPEPTPYHTAPTTQIQTETAVRRPTVDTSLASPTPAPRIREVSDDDEAPSRSPEAVDSNSDLYRQKIEALKSELGSNWLTALSEDRFAEQQTRNRSYSPTSRTSTVKSGDQVRGVSVGARTLG
ncbi:hypothetical protein BAUCODRAFT_73819 [Baudoinia panamericana UAMH 10762]|uniref:Leucine-rich repeat-containing protein n=1 Tax=Baudoinia panamericana (strain UAMH 10762) TaxID=717646 RepID=M2N6Q2_BAUPA|nr:uncharacterized protein BAUCODRAFT_73819 [Baudoinia panamericana UAMH 10762]EMC94455.1 hypothetical protein BAUCODRAFT_73819 [Baudoinia panamericana UAMH 10762]